MIHWLKNGKRMNKETKGRFGWGVNLNDRIVEIIMILQATLFRERNFKPCVHNGWTLPSQNGKGTGHPDTHAIAVKTI